MNFIESPTFKKYFVPGIIFQSVVIAGGYGTGRELVEFFLNFGVIGGFIAMVVISTLVWSVVCAATFEFSRVFKAYDYRTFFSKLLGKSWWLYEICYFGLLLIVLAVIASSAGTILFELFGLPYFIGVIGMMAGVGALVFLGNEAIEKFLSYWTFILYAVYILFLIITFTKFGDNIIANFAQGTIEKGWAGGGFKYAFYNLGIIPAVLFSVRHIETRKEAIGAGILAGIIGIIPVILLLIAMIAFYPEMLSIAVPTNFVLSAININALQIGFQITLFGTLIETGTGFIFAITNRVDSVYAEDDKPTPSWINPIITISLLTLGVFIAKFGLIDLISKGYGTITWGFFIFYVIPILTMGIWKIKSRELEIGQLSSKNI